MHPEIIGHRGAPRERRENTLPSFAQALDEGADGVELDVHMTRDNVIVVHHDRTVSAAMHASSAGAALRDVTAGALRDMPLDSGDLIPTLDEVFALVDGRATVYVEVKAAGIEAALAACLQRWPLARVAVHAFDHRIPVAVRALCPELDIGLLSASYPIDIAAVLRGTAATALWQQAELIDEALVREVHDMGARVIAWTENDPERARALIGMGVDAICTDTPGLLRAGLGL